MDGQPDRTRRREFIRTHHPDRGGDTESVVAGLCQWDEQTPKAAALLNQVPVTVEFSPWPVSLITLTLRKFAGQRRRVCRLVGPVTSRSRGDSVRDV